MASCVSRALLALLPIKLDAYMNTRSHLARMSVDRKRRVTALYCSSALHRIALFVALASAVALLFFPALIKQHNFYDHFRAPQIRQQIIRHTFTEKTTDIEGSDRAVKIDSLPFESIIAQPQYKVRPLPSVELTPPASLTRLFLRLKLGSTCGSEPDPLA